MLKLMFQQPHNILTENQSGQASFIVTMIIMVVITLIILGFSQLATNTSRQSLDNALSTAAYYAAESGVNAAYTRIQQDEQAGNPIESQTGSCTYTNQGTDIYSSNQNLNTTPGVAYTCLLVNPTPPTLEFKPLYVGASQVVPVFGQDAITNVHESVNTINISWQADGLNSYSYSNCPGVGTFPAESLWPSSASCSAGVLQIDIVPAEGWVNPTQLQAASRTIYLYPNSSTAAPSATAISNGSIIAGNCQTSASGGYEYDCTAILNMSTMPAPYNTMVGQGYYLHVTPIYENADLSLSADNASGNQVNLYNAQALIDSTGKANYVLKRIQERVSINPVESNDVPSYAIQSAGGICKQMSVMPGTAQGPPASGGC